MEVEMNSGVQARRGRDEHWRLFYSQRSMHDMQKTLGDKSMSTAMIGLEDCSIAGG